MRRSISLAAMIISLLVCTYSYSQSQTVNADSLQKVRMDSALRVMMRDSINLSDQTITAVFALRDSGILRTERVITNTGLTPGQRMVAIQTLRSETDDAIKQAMGSTAYQRYLDILVGRRPE